MRYICDKSSFLDELSYLDYQTMYCCNQCYKKAAKLQNKLILTYKHKVFTVTKKVFHKHNILKILSCLELKM